MDVNKYIKWLVFDMILCYWSFDILVCTFNFGQKGRHRWAVSFSVLKDVHYGRQRLLFPFYNQHILLLCRRISILTRMMIMNLPVLRTYRTKKMRKTPFDFFFSLSFFLTCSLSFLSVVLGINWKPKQVIVPDFPLFSSIRRTRWPWWVGSKAISSRPFVWRHWG